MVVDFAWFVDWCDFDCALRIVSIVCYLHVGGLVVYFDALYLFAPDVLFW